MQTSAHEGDERVREHVVRLLVGEVVLCCGEVNGKTREGALAGLVEISRRVQAEEGDGED